MAGGHKAMGVAKRTCAHAHNVLVDRNCNRFAFCLIIDIGEYIIYGLMHDFA